MVLFEPTVVLPRYLTSTLACAVVELAHDAKGVHVVHLSTCDCTRFNTIKCTLPRTAVWRCEIEQQESILIFKRVVPKGVTTRLV